MTDRSGRTGAINSASDPAREDGRIGLLMGACLLIVASFVLVSSAITAVAIEDRRLLACADRIAAATAGVIDADAYYAGGSARLVVSEDSALEVARRALVDLSSTTCDVGFGAEVVAAARNGGEVRVGVRARAELPLVPGILEGVVAPVLERSSTARVSEVP
ncbi:hypothetical protein [Actinomyces culturomici]|uniref:hypothetical protein n=1 Tax=Actinomyces culturomici TaxID=1926276 RepID=UPI000E209CA8|nr:hypothetical protein [Actinomyces culturomici]